MDLAVHERKKYEKAWAIPEYHRFSPGLHMLPMFRAMVRKHEGTLVDIGAGGGKASAVLADLGWTVTMLDHVKVKEAPQELAFVKANIFGRWTRLPHWDQGFCCDVMEHIPPGKVDAALKNILGHCGRVFFSISFQPDHFGKVVGHPLHLTVEPFAWWVKKLGAHGKVKQARDLLGEGVFDVVA